MSRVGITVEGGLLAADLVERVALGDEAVRGQQAKDFDIEAGRLSAEIQAAFSDIRVFWDAFKRRREHAQTSAVTLTREGWVIPFLERLGYALRFQRAGVLIGGQNYLLSHRVSDGESATPVHIVAWNQLLGQRGDDKRSPHALMQEYLNRGDALWGIVTNGRELRILRNSARSSRPSYVAVDLETILDGNLYNEFAVVYRLLHRTRLPADSGDPHDCLLETWYEQGIEEGGRVRDGLRVGVKAALETLGSGFLRHEDNNALRAKITDRRLTEAQLYRELLNLIYRLLFLMVAEERRLLFVPAADATARHDVYLRWYGIGRLRELAEGRPGDNGYGDFWEGLKETFRLFREEPAAAKLALSALNGELFGVTALPNLEDSDTRLRNNDLLDAIRQLSTFEERAGRKKTGVRRRVNYAGLDVEELGSILLTVKIDIGEQEKERFRKKWRDVEAVLSRAALVNLPFENYKELYEYSCWVGIEGQMLKRVYKDQQKIGQTTKTRRYISLDESNEALRLFREKAAWWRGGLTPRTLEQIAKARIGVDHAIWLADCQRFFMATEPVQTPHDLPLFQIERPVKKSKDEPARPATEKAESPEPEPVESRSEFTVASAQSAVSPPLAEAPFSTVLDIGKPEKPQYGDVWLQRNRTGSFGLVAHSGSCILNGSKKFETREFAESRLREIRDLPIEQRTDIYMLSADTVEEGLAKIKKVKDHPAGSHLHHPKSSSEVREIINGIVARTAERKAAAPEEDKSDYMVSPTGRVHYENGQWVVQQLCEIGDPEHPQGRWAMDATAPFETREAAIAAAPEILARMEKADTDEIRDAEKRKKRELVRVDSLEPLRYMTATRENATHWRRWEEYQDDTGDWRTVPGSVRVDPLKPKPQEPVQPEISEDRIKPIPPEGAAVQVNNDRRGDVRAKWWEWFEPGDPLGPLNGRWWIVPDTLIVVPHDSFESPELPGYTVVIQTNESGTTEKKAVPITGDPV